MTEGPETTSTIRRSRSAERGVAAWDLMEKAVVLVAAALAALGISGLFLAMLGWWSLPLTVLIAAVPVVIAVWLLARGPRYRPSYGAAPLLGVLALVLVVSVFWAFRPSQHVLVNRDPGSYADTAVLVANTGALAVDQSQSPFGRLDGAPEGATYVVGQGRYEFQFNHLLSTVLAPAYALGGQRLMFRMPALMVGLGLLGIYLFAVRMTRRPWLSMLVPAVLGASAPFLYVARDTFSESITFALLWIALLAGHRAVQKVDLPWAVIAGFLMGSTTAARVDSLLYAIALAPVLVIWAIAGRESTRRDRVRLAVGFGSGAIVPVVIGYLDLDYFTGRYVHDLGSQVTGLRVAVLASIAAGALAAVATPWLRDRIAQWREGIALAAGAGAAAVMLFLWFVRPAFLVDYGNSQAMIGGLQAAEGWAAEPTRTHYEASMVWMSWYLGPVLVAIAVIGLSVVVYRAVVGSATVAELMVLAVVGVAGLLYWWQPSIVGDQLWGSRRFMPAVYPAVAVLAVAALGWFSLSLARSGFPHRRVLMGGVAMALVLAVASTTWPVKWGRTQAGYQGSVASTCRTIGSDAAVVTIETVVPKPMAPAVRAWCNVPTVSLENPTPELLSELASEWKDEGRRLWLVTADPKLADQYRPPGNDVIGSVRAAGTDAVERTVTRPPSRYRAPEPFMMWMVEISQT